MAISAQLAQTIVDSLASELQQQLNFFDENGYILASTQKNRIGTLHGGAARLIREGLEELFIHEDGEYEGALKGCNYSIEIDGRVIGAIGISGECDAVYRYGRIIKKMTELQIRESDALERKKLADRIRDRFFSDWILTDIDCTQAEFIRRADALHVRLDLPRRVAVFQPVGLAKYRDSDSGQKTIDRINHAVRAMTGAIRDAHFGKTPSQMICLLPYGEDEQMRRFVQSVIERVNAQFGEPLAAGIDSAREFGRVSVHQAYERASRALDACLHAGEPLLFYDDANYEMLLADIPVRTQEAFVRRIFRGCTDEEIDEYCALIRAYYGHDGSITQAAADRFIHKNTVQYQLNRIAEVTGRNPRRWENIPLFYLAILFHERLR